MIDLPANITWPATDDGWSVEQRGECIESVQAFRENRVLIVELWGKTIALSPAGKRYTPTSSSNKASTSILGV